MPENIKLRKEHSFLAVWFLHREQNGGKFEFKHQIHYWEQKWNKICVNLIFTPHLRHPCRKVNFHFWTKFASQEQISSNISTQNALIYNRFAQLANLSKSFFSSSV